VLEEIRLGRILSAPFQGNIKQKSTNKRIFLGKSCYNYSKLALIKVRNRERINPGG
jgi:hypothetical protein